MHFNTKTLAVSELTAVTYYPWLQYHGLPCTHALCSHGPVLRLPPMFFPIPCDISCHRIPPFSALASPTPVVSPLSMAPPSGLIPPLPPSRGILCLTSPPCAPPPPSPATDIACREKDVGARADWNEMGWQTRVGSALFGRCLRKPLAMVR